MWRSILKCEKTRELEMLTEFKGMLQSIGGSTMSEGKFC